MESKKLHFTNPHLPFTVLATDRELTEIEVPAGESHFRIEQIGSSNSRRYRFHLRQAGSQVLITGLVRASQQETPELFTEVIHHQPNTKAETLIRTLVEDQANPRYQGVIRMEKVAQQSESYLNHHALLIGPRARSWSLPSLEILADQVKCSHAATVRTITELDLFYLRSRGVSRAEAEATLIEAFLADLKRCKGSRDLLRLPFTTGQAASCSLSQNEGREGHQYWRTVSATPYLYYFTNAGP